MFFILGGVAAAAAIQELYERAYDLDRRGAKDIVRQLAWLVVLAGCAWLAGRASSGLRAAGGPVLLAVIGLIVFTGFWWFTMWFLLAGRIAWRALFPSAVATAVCWVGMEAVFSVIFSGMVISDDQKYGSIGVVFALMSWLIAIGVVIILGAVTGVVWQERKPVVQRRRQIADSPDLTADHEALTVSRQPRAGRASPEAAADASVGPRRRAEAPS